MKYSMTNDIIFVVLALVASLALLSRQGLVSATFFALALLYIIFEHKITSYWKSA